MTKGIFLCIEGGDGSGKGTQYQLLVDRLKDAGRDVATIDLPQYDEPSGKDVSDYLNGKYGDPTKVDAHFASYPFAIDRFTASKTIIERLGEGAIVIANRFTASNMAHQGSKIKNQSERIEFFNWLHTMEHGWLGIPEPDYHFILHVPAEIAQQRVLQKAARSYTDKKLDGHEADLDYQRRTEQTYLDLAATFPNRFGVIECVEGNYQKTPDEIHNEIWAKVKELI